MSGVQIIMLSLHRDMPWLDTITIYEQFCIVCVCCKLAKQHICGFQIQQFPAIVIYSISDLIRLQEKTRSSKWWEESGHQNSISFDSSDPDMRHSRDSWARDDDLEYSRHSSGRKNPEYASDRAHREQAHLSRRHRDSNSEYWNDYNQYEDGHRRSNGTAEIGRDIPSARSQSHNADYKRKSRHSEDYPSSKRPKDSDQWNHDKFDPNLDEPVDSSGAVKNQLNRTVHQAAKIYEPQSQRIILKNLPSNNMNKLPHQTDERKKSDAKSRQDEGAQALQRKKGPASANDQDSAVGTVNRDNPRSVLAVSKQDPKVDRETFGDSKVATVMEAVTEEQNKEAGNKASRKIPIIWNPKSNAPAIKLPPHKLEESLKRQQEIDLKAEALKQQELARKYEIARKAEKQRKKEEERKAERLRVQQDIAEKAEQIRLRHEREKQEKAERKSAAKKRQKAAKNERKRKAAENLAEDQRTQQAQDALPEPPGNQNATETTAQADNPKGRKLSKAEKKAQKRLEADKAAQIDKKTQLHLETKNGTLVGLKGPPLPPGAIIPSNEELPPPPPRPSKNYQGALKSQSSLQEQHVQDQNVQKEHVQEQFEMLPGPPQIPQDSPMSSLPFPPGFFPNDPRPSELPLPPQWPNPVDMLSEFNSRSELQGSSPSADKIQSTPSLEELRSQSLEKMRKQSSHKIHAEAQPKQDCEYTAGQDTVAKQIKEGERVQLAEDSAKATGNSLVQSETKQAKEIPAEEKLMDEFEDIIDPNDELGADFIEL